MPSQFLKILVILTALVGLGIFYAHKDEQKQRIRKDFSTYTLAASKVLFAGDNPYDRQIMLHNYKYFPTNAILLRPFIHMNVYHAQGAWFAFNVGLLLIAFWQMGLLAKPLKIPCWIYLLTVFLMFRAINSNLRLGQWNTSVFCFSIIGVSLLARQRRPLGAIILGLAITLKYMPVIFLAYFAVRRRWKDFAATAAAVLFWILMFPLIAMGPTRGTQLLTQFASVTPDRINKITEATETSSVSMYSTIYRALTPVIIELKGIHFTADVFNLTITQAANIAKIFSVLFLASALAWIAWRTNRNRPNIIGELLLIGMCYLIWFIAMPGVRHAQLISLVPLIFGLIIAARHAPASSIRWGIAAGLFLAMLMYNSTAQVRDESRYNLLLEANGIVSWALVVLALTGFYAYEKTGQRPLDEALTGPHFNGSITTGATDAPE